MRKISTAAATTCLAVLGLAVPAATAQAAPAGNVSIQADCSPNGTDGYVYAWKDSVCSGLLGKDLGNDSNWSNSDDPSFSGSDEDNATSVANNGFSGGKDVVAFYRLRGGSSAYEGGYLCLRAGHAITDLRNYTFTNGDTANDKISSHAWVYASGCKAGYIVPN